MSIDKGNIEGLGDRVDWEAGRRAFVASLGLGALGAAVFGSSTGAQAQAADNGAVLNFALNLEYLEAEYYLQAAFGRGLAQSDITGRGTLGPVTGPVRRVNFSTRFMSNFSRELAAHEERHVQFLRAILGEGAVARPAISFNGSFTAAARAAGLIGPNDTFDAFANETNFLLAAFIFEDVGVTAYQGAAGLVSGGRIAAIASSILAVEAYHAGAIRTVMNERGLFDQANRIANLRDTLDGPGTRDAGVGDNFSTIVVPVDGAAVVHARTPRQVLNIVYASVDQPRGGFFPAGMNGAITS